SARNDDRNRPASRSAVTELTSVVVAPTVRHAAGCHSARVRAPGTCGADRGESGATCDRHGRGSFRVRTVAELSEGVVAPAGGHTSRSETAAVIGPSCCRGEGKPNLDRYWARPLGRGAVAKLAVTIDAPAVGRAAGHHAAGVPAPGAYCCEGERAGHKHWAR